MLLTRNGGKKKMYQIGELVQYGNSGVCKIEEIVQGIPGLEQNVPCYLLIPIGKKDGKIYSPIEIGEAKMRRVLSKEEANELLEKAWKNDGLCIANEKQCEHIYREELHSGDCYRWLLLLKTLYARKTSRTTVGKKITATDERYMKNVEDRLKEELNIVIGQEETVSALDKLLNSAK